MTFLKIENANKVNPKVSAAVNNALEDFRKSIDKLDPYNSWRYRKNVLERMTGHFRDLSKELQAIYPNRDIKSIYTRIAAYYVNEPESFCVLYLAAKAHDLSFAMSLNPLLEKGTDRLKSNPFSAFFLELQEDAPETFGSWVPAAFSLRLTLAACKRDSTRNSLTGLIKTLRNYKGPWPGYPNPTIREIHHCYSQIFPDSLSRDSEKLPVEALLVFQSEKIRKLFFSKQLSRDFFGLEGSRDLERIKKINNKSFTVFSKIAQLLKQGDLSELDLLMNKELADVFESKPVKIYKGLPSFLDIKKETLLQKDSFFIKGFLSKKNFIKLQILTQFPLPKWFCGEKETVLRSFEKNPSLFDLINQKTFKNFFFKFGEEFLKVCIKAGYEKNFTLPKNFNYQVLSWTTVLHFAFSPQDFVKTFLGEITSSDDIELVRLLVEKNPNCIPAFIHAISEDRAKELRIAILRESEVIRRKILKLIPENDPIWSLADWTDLVANCVSERVFNEYALKSLLASKKTASHFLEESQRWNKPLNVKVSTDKQELAKHTPRESLLEYLRVEVKILRQKRRQENERKKADPSLRIKWLTKKILKCPEARRRFITDFYGTPLWKNFKKIESEGVKLFILAQDISTSTSYQGSAESRIELISSLFSGFPLSAQKKQLIIKNFNDSEIKKIFAPLNPYDLKKTVLAIGFRYAHLFPKWNSQELLKAIEQARIDALSGSQYFHYLIDAVKNGKTYVKKRNIAKKITKHRFAADALLAGSDASTTINIVRKKPEIEVGVLSLLEKNAWDLLSTETQNALILEKQRLNLSERDFFDLLAERRRKGESLICVPELKTPYEIAVAILNTNLKLKELKSLHEKVDAAVFSEACHLVNLSVKKDAGNAPYWIELIEKLGWDVCNDLSHVISITNWEAGHGNHYNSAYKQWEIPKKNGGKRLISSPISTLKIIQRRIYEKLLLALPVHEASFGFVPNRSIVDNAALHVAKPCVVCVDIKSCFPSVKYPLVASTLLRELKGVLQPNTIRLVAEICSAEGGLPIGAPTSPVILNLVLKKTDSILTEHAKKLGCSYTRYADDMTFSGGNETTKMIGIAKGTLCRIGLNLDPKKTNIFRRGRRQCCTGLVVNEKVNVNRIYLRRLRAEVHRLSKGRTPTWMGERDTPEAVIGRINFVNSVSPEKALHLKQILKNAGVA